MSTIRICDICGDAIEVGEEVPSVHLPADWWLALGVEPTDKSIDVCSTACLVTLAEKTDDGLRAAEDPTPDFEPEEEEEPQGERPSEPTFRPVVTQTKLRPPTSEEINAALGITERGSTGV